jgi:predicted dienelactone hydrolase
VDTVDDDAGVPAPPAPPFDAVGRFETTIAASEDPADVYHPDPPDLHSGGYALPVALLLQGADVGRAHYQLYATAMASWGFVVVVPDHDIVSVAGPGLYAEQEQVHDVLELMRTEFEDPSSPLRGAIDPNTLVLLGHSYGGACGLNAIRGVCEMPFCMGGFTRPDALKGGAFWGTNLAVPMVGTIPEVDNDGLPVILVQGTLDSMATPEDGRRTYDEIVHPPRAYAEIDGANHYGICNVNNPTGAEPDETAPALAQPVSIETAARLGALFLRAHVLGDAEARAFIHEGGHLHDEHAEVVMHDPG